MSENPDAGPRPPTEAKDAAVSHPPSSEQAHGDTQDERTPGLGPDHQHRLGPAKSPNPPS